MDKNAAATSLYRLGQRLDKQGLKEEADLCDKVLKSFSQEDTYLGLYWLENETMIYITNKVDLTPKVMSDLANKPMPAEQKKQMLLDFGAVQSSEEGNAENVDFLFDDDKTILRLPVKQVFASGGRHQEFNEQEVRTWLNSKQVSNTLVEELVNLLREGRDLNEQEVMAFWKALLL